MIQDYFHNFKQEVRLGADVEETFSLSAFVDATTKELEDAGIIEGFTACFHRNPRGTMRVDGYCFDDDEGVLDLFIADFDSRDTLMSLSRTEVDGYFRRLRSFFEQSISKKLFKDLENTSPVYGLSRLITDQKDSVSRVNFYLLSERELSERMQTMDSEIIAEKPVSFHIWDISRFFRMHSSQGQKEPLDIDFREMFGKGIACLPANTDSSQYESFLAIIPGKILADLYEKYGSRLLEQNVRSFLQARGKVNKGIRNTIMAEPDMFFAYNNGITATAQEVETEVTENATQITRIKDLQIVNGGQTTASLFHTRRKDKASLDHIFVQMKLSRIDNQDSERVVPRISEYANTQNKVNATDFFSNHAFHIRIQEFSGRIWAPAKQGELRETKWFYERVRGQYVDELGKKTAADQRRFKTEYPKSQMFTKTDLGKYENIWEDHPRWVNLGGQKNFSKFAERIGAVWEKSDTDFNEFFYQRLIARAIIFKTAEKLVSDQPWYGGHRANIVAYTIAVLNACCKRKKLSVDYQQIWRSQGLSKKLEEVLKTIAKFVNDQITNPPQGFSNVGEWCKKDGCWIGLESKISDIERLIPVDFWDTLITEEELRRESTSAKKTQVIDDGIQLQAKIFEVSASQWTKILKEGSAFLTPKEIGILKIAEKIPKKLPTERQCAVLMDVLNKAKDEGVIAD